MSHKSSTSSLNSSTPNNNWKNSENLARDNRVGSPQLNRSNESSDSKPTNTPPSKPPRFALNSSNNNAGNSPVSKPPKAEDEWGQKLYGLQTSNALKRLVVVKKKNEITMSKLVK